ncbi:MAG: TonB-dependent receptor [Bacteroidia bacterium]|nr:TonB-dependent receptor [Bacteroidia bacterium]
MKKLVLTIAVLIPLFAFAQTKDNYQISGKVLSPELKSMEGVSVLVTLPNGGSSGGITDQQGNFSVPISAEKQSKLFVRLSFVGFNSIYDTLNLANLANGKIYYMQPASKDLEAVNITSSIIADPNAPIANQTLNKAEIRKNNLGQDLPVLLNATPSLVFTTDAGAGVGYSALRIRGSDQTRINVTLNGIPLNDPETQGVFFVNMPDFASSAYRIDIQRGVGASTNGTGAFGANINLETFNRSMSPSFEINNSFGSFNTRKHTVAFNTGLINNHWKMSGRMSRIYSDGYIDRAFSDLKSYYIDASYRSTNQRFTLEAIHFAGSERTYQAWWGTPESRFTGDVNAMNDYADRNFLSPTQRQNLLHSGRTYNYYEYDNETDNYSQSHYQLHANYLFNKYLKLSVSGFYIRGLGNFEQSMPAQRYEDYGIEPFVQGADTLATTDLVRKLWLDNHFFGSVYGLHYQNNKTIVQFGGGLSRYLGDHYDDVIWAVIAGNMPKDYRFASSYSVKNDVNHFVKVTRKINDRFSVYADLQFRYVAYKADGLDDNRVPFAFDKQFAFFNPKGGVNYALKHNQRLYFSIANTKREPVRMDFIESAPDVPKHESLTDYEFGYQKRTKKYLLDVNLYYMDYINQLVLTGEMNAVGGLIRKNAGKSYRAGFELQGKYIINDYLNVGGNVTLSRNIIKDYKEVVFDWYGVIEEQHFEYKNTPISFSPSVVSAVFAELKFKSFTANVTGKYVGLQYLDNSGMKESVLSPYATGDFRLAYKLPGKKTESEMVLMVNNFTNQLYASNGYTYKYYLGSTDAFYSDKMVYPQAGINFLLGLNIRFQ